MSHVTVTKQWTNYRTSLFHFFFFFFFFWKRCQCSVDPFRSRKKDGGVRCQYATSGVTCFKIRITSSKLAACWWEKLKVQTCIFWLRISFLPSKSSSSFQSFFTFIPFSYPWPHITSYNNDGTKVFLPIYSTIYSLFLPIRVSNSTSLCISIFWGGKTFFEAWRFLETRENLDSSLKWTLDKCKRFRTIRVSLSFFFQTYKRIVNERGKDVS